MLPRWYSTALGVMKKLGGYLAVGHMLSDQVSNLGLATSHFENRSSANRPMQARGGEFLFGFGY